MTNIIIWNENIHEQENEEVKKIYPNGIHSCIKNFLLTNKTLHIDTATLTDQNNGINKKNIKDCDVSVSYTHLRAHET